jgi:predicted MFS family arabinose efflux permease
VIVYACAFVGLIFFGRIADITNQRGLTLAAANAVAVLGYALLLGLTSGKARFAATCVLAFGVYPTIILQISWLTMSTVGYTKRGSSLAFVNIFSQIFSICGNQAYIDPPYYRHGNATSLGLSALAVIVSLLLSWYFRFRNAQKIRDQWKPETAELRQKSFEELGDGHPDFFYIT